MARPTIGQEPWGATLNADLNQIEANANSRIAQSEKGATDGVAPLDESGRLPENNVPQRLTASTLNSTYFRRDEEVTGPQGDPGDPGTPGSVWYSGAGAPSSGAGIINDFYANTSNGDYYKKTDVAVWTLQGNLMGPQGNDGPVGDEGPIGPKGDVGSPGPNGEQVYRTLGNTAYVMTPAKGTDYTFKLTGDLTLSSSGLHPGQFFYVFLWQDGVGGHDVFLPATWIGEDAITLTTTANFHDVLVVWESQLGTHVKHVATGEMPSGFWEPDNFSDQRGWFDATGFDSDLVDTVITSWPNKYAEADMVLNGSTTLRSLYNQKYVEFDGSDYGDANIVDTGTTTPITIGIVVRVWGASGVVPVVSGNGLNDVNLVVDGTSPRSWTIDSSPTALSATVSNTNGVWETVVVTINSASGLIRRDSAQVTADTTNKSLTTIQLGRKNQTATYGTIDVAEVVVVKKLATTQEITDLEAHLNIKRDLLNGA